MKTTLVISFLLALSVLNGVGVPPLTQNVPVTLTSGSAVIAEVKGEVVVHSAEGNVIPAQRGQVLPAESSIETLKGSLVLNLQDGSQVLVVANSRVTLKAPEQAQGNFLQLFIGKIMAKIQKRTGNAPSFRMGTPTAVITVRGTRFSVEVTKKNKTIVEVYEGLVEVAGLATPNHPIMIKPGFYTQIESDRPPQSPHEMPGAENPGGRGAENEGESPLQHNQGAGEAERNLPPGAHPAQNQHEGSAPSKSEGPD